MLLGLVAIIVALGHSTVTVLQTIKLTKCTTPECVSFNTNNNDHDINAIQQRVLPTKPRKGSSEVPRKSSEKKSNCRRTESTSETESDDRTQESNCDIRLITY